MKIKHISYFPRCGDDGHVVYITRTRRGVHRTRPNHSGTIQYENVTRASVERLVEVVTHITYKEKVGHIAPSTSGWVWFRHSQPHF